MKRATSVQPYFGRGVAADRGQELLGDRTVEARTRAEREVDEGRARSPSNSSRQCASASASSRSGANRKFTVTVQASGITLPAMPPRDRDRVHALAVGQAVHVHLPRLGSRQPGQHARAASWMALCPSQARAECAATPRGGDREAQRALAAALDPGAGRLHQDGEVAGQPLGVLARDPGERVVLGRDLLVVVEDPGEVAGRRGRARAAQASATATPPFMSHGAAAVDQVALDAGTAGCPRPARCRGARRSRPARRARGRCGRSRCRRRAPRAGAAARRRAASTRSASAALVAADRLDVHDCAEQGHQVTGQVEAHGRQPSDAAGRAGPPVGWPP